MEYLALSFDPNAKRSGSEKTKEREKPGRRDLYIQCFVVPTYPQPGETKWTLGGV